MLPLAILGAEKEHLMTAESAKPDSEKPNAKKGPSKEVNKSEEIRKIANSKKAKGEKPRPVDIIAILKKQGIEVSSPQVSMVLKKMGFTLRKRRKSSELGAPSAAANGKPASKVKLEDLVKAKRLATQMGGIDKAFAALTALKNFEE